MVEQGVSAVVMEVSSHALVLGRVAVCIRRCGVHQSEPGPSRLPPRHGDYFPRQGVPVRAGPLSTCGGVHRRRLGPTSGRRHHGPHGHLRPRPSSGLGPAGRRHPGDGGWSGQTVGPVTVLPPGGCPVPSTRRTLAAAVAAGGPPRPSRKGSRTAPESWVAWSPWVVPSSPRSLTTLILRRRSPRHRRSAYVIRRTGTGRALAAGRPDRQNGPQGSVAARRRRPDRDR